MNGEVSLGQRRTLFRVSAHSASPKHFCRVTLAQLQAGRSTQLPSSSRCRSTFLLGMSPRQTRSSTGAPSAKATAGTSRGRKATKVDTEKADETASEPEPSYAQKLKQVKEFMASTMPNATPKEINSKARKYLADIKKDAAQDKE